MSREGFNYFYTRSRLHVVRHERLATEILDPQRRARRKRMFRAHDEREFVLQYRKRLKLAILWFRSHQRKVDVAFEHLTRQVARDVPHDLDLHVGMAFAKRKD